MARGQHRRKFKHKSLGILLEFSVANRILANLGDYVRDLVGVQPGGWANDEHL
jgi:hypothetical protein